MAVFNPWLWLLAGALWLLIFWLITALDTEPFELRDAFAPPLIVCVVSANNADTFAAPPFIEPNPRALTRVAGFVILHASQKIVWSGYAYIVESGAACGPATEKVDNVLRFPVVGQSNPRNE